MNIICGKDQGIRKGSIVLWYGPYSSFKSWIALEMCREAQKKWPDKIVAYFDTEYRVDMEVATKLVGINVEPHENGVPRFIYIRPDTAEETWEQIGDFTSSGLFSIIVLDSNTAMRSRKIVEESEFKHGEIGAAARISSAALQKYAPKFVESGTILWTISQERVESKGPFMVQAPTGGQAWRFYATHEFRVEGVTNKKGEEDQEIQIYVKKNKFSPSLLTVKVPMVMGVGIYQEADIIKTAVSYGLARQSGAYYYYGEQTLGQGMDNSAAFLLDHPEVKAEILQKLYHE